MSKQITIKPLHTFLFGLSLSLLILASAIGGAIADRLFVIKPLNILAPQLSDQLQQIGDNDTVSTLTPGELSVVDAAEKASQSVVTISIKKKERIFEEVSPFGMFGFGFGQRIPEDLEQVEEIQHDIGTGFAVDSEAGLIVTNRHVIADTDAEYLVIDKSGKEYEVKKLYRDPSNDIGIVQIDEQLPSLELGNSELLKVGQSVIAIGTALGEFRHTVTTGVISGLGRGIDASDGFGFQTERLDNVIQTDAAINPGNSGGPLLNANGQVIGVNVAVAGGAQNIGFAIPINTIKEVLTNFNQTGKFDRPFFGVQYQMIPQRSAVMNGIPQGAYIVEVVPGSSASDAGLEPDDVITSFDGKKLNEDVDLASLINAKKIGDSVEVKYWRDDEEKTVRVTLKERSE